uniref:Uncharacterized protein n=1 Tax=Oryza brachyantha TaxID=4533 RepID=J3M8V0_ORYBR
MSASTPRGDTPSPSATISSTVLAIPRMAPTYSFAASLHGRTRDIDLKQFYECCSDRFCRTVYRSEDDGAGEASERAAPSIARRRYSSHPMSPLRPMRLFPYPNGEAGPRASFSACGDAKNRTASASSRLTTPSCTPWFTAL